MSGPQHVDVAVVGAGFAGMYMVLQARELNLDVQCVEAASGVGGTWYWNRYPGARCDIESMEYSYGFDEQLQQEWEWSERYATQPEILRYAEHVADRYDLRRHIRFDTRVKAATFDDERGRWLVETDSGEDLDAQFLVMATGCLSVPIDPAIPGLQDFAGETVRTASWPQEGVDVSGKRVGVIGTGSSAIQAVPILAEQADALIVFQRTPAFTVPAHNRALDPAEVAAIKDDYGRFRADNREMPSAFGSRLPRRDEGALDVEPAERLAEYEARWERGGLPFIGSFTDLLIDETANETAADFVRDKIRSIVADPDVAERLMPSQVIGCKRLCVDTGYYETFNKPNVELVDLAATPIETVAPAGVRTTAGHHDLDVLVLATGFDAMTGALTRIDIRGRGDRTLAEVWTEGPRTYLGLGVAGFPNLFIITGPGSPSVLTNMLVSIEHHVDWISDCLAHMRSQGHRRIEADVEAQDGWVDFVNAVAGLTLFPTCGSWYLGANVPGKTRVFMPLPGFPTYRETADAVAAEGYKGFTVG